LVLDDEPHQLGGLRFTSHQSLPAIALAGWDQLAEIVPNRANPAWSSFTTTGAFPSNSAF
jgi:hypothetical protein